MPDLVSLDAQINYSVRDDAHLSKQSAFLRGPLLMERGKESSGQELKHLHELKEVRSIAFFKALETASWPLCSPKSRDTFDG